MNAQKPPLSHPVIVTNLPDEGLQVTVVANETERAALAQMDGLVGLPSLEGRFLLKRDRAGQGVAVHGEVSATVLQTCVVSLDPFENEVREQVDLLFLPEERLTAWLEKKAKEAQEDDEKDPPDTIVAGRIDLGEVTAEFLAIGIDPYPRKPGVEFDSTVSQADKDPSPFAVLAKLKEPGAET